jgi:hypothetical protein
MRVCILNQVLDENSSRYLYRAMHTCLQKAWPRVGLATRRFVKVWNKCMFHVLFAKACTHLSLLVKQATL